jgi:cell shape-determining protein MreD
MAVLEARRNAEAVSVKIRLVRWTAAGALAGLVIGIVSDAGGTWPLGVHMVIWAVLAWLAGISYDDA